MKIKEVKQRIGDLFDKAQSSKHRVIKEIIRYVTEMEAQTIEQQTGIKIDMEFKHIIDTSAINHILNNHSNEKTEARRGQKAITKKDFEMIPTIINHYDTIKISYLNRKSLETIIYTKTYSDGTTYIIEEVRRNRKELALNTMYKLKK